MELPVSGPPAWFDWRGVRWYRNRNGYYQDRTGQLLHRFVYQALVGPLDAGDDVHHRDENKANNAPANLERIDRGAHRRHHGIAAHHPAWIEQRDPNVASERSKAAWARRLPHSVICDGCGETFHSTGQRARFCTPRCAAAFNRRQRRKALTPGSDL